MFHILLSAPLDIGWLILQLVFCPAVGGILQTFMETWKISLEITLKMFGLTFCQHFCIQLRHIKQRESYGRIQWLYPGHQFLFVIETSQKPILRVKSLSGDEGSPSGSSQTWCCLAPNLRTLDSTDGQYLVIEMKIWNTIRKYFTGWHIMLLQTSRWHWFEVAFSLWSFY